MVKFLKLISGLALLFVFLQGYGYFNLMVSEKYETDDTVIELSDMSEEDKAKELLKMDNRFQEIQAEKKNMILRGGIALVLFLTICFWITQHLKRIRKSN